MNLNFSLNRISLAFDKRKRLGRKLGLKSDYNFCYQPLLKQAFSITPLDLFYDYRPRSTSEVLLKFHHWFFVSYRNLFFLDNYLDD